MTKFIYRIWAVIVFYILGDWGLTYIGLTYFNCVEYNPIARVLFAIPILPLVLKLCYIPLLYWIDMSYPKETTSIIIWIVSIVGVLLCCNNLYALINSGLMTCLGR